MQIIHDIEELWNRITELLAESQPELLEDLRDGATDVELDSLEEKIGINLPDDFRQLYLLNNGQGKLGESFAIEMFDGGIFEGYYFMPLEGEGSVSEEWERFVEMAESGSDDFEWGEIEGHVQNVFASSKWIPFAKDASGNYLCVDLEPDGDGIEGQAIEVAYDDDRIRVLADSLDEYLEALVSIIESNV